jgi:Protein of unknown function (DUF4019)
MVGFARARLRSIAASLALLFACIQIAAGQGSDKDGAERAASLFLSEFDSTDLGSLYSRMGPTFRQIYTQEQFVQQAGMMRLQLGGTAAGRLLVGSQAMNQMPNGIRGDFFYVRYKARYPNGFVFQDTMLEKAGDEWRVGGFNFLPAPPN